MEEDNFNENQNEEKKLYSNINPVTAGFLGLIIVFILYQFVGGIITVLIVGLDLEKANQNSVRLLTAAGQLLFILLPALIMTKSFYTDVTNAVRVRLARPKDFIIYTVGMIFLIPLIQSYMYIQTYLVKTIAQNNDIVKSLKNAMDQLDKMVSSSYEGLLTPHNVLDGLVIIIVVSVVPAICEEAFFRGFVLRSFEFKMKAFWAALLSAVFFGLYHFNPYGLVPLIALGWFFGFSAYKTNSISIPVYLHFLNNFFSLVAFYIIGAEELNTPDVKGGQELTTQIYVFITFLLAFSGFIYYIVRDNRKQ